MSQPTQFDILLDEAKQNAEQRNYWYGIAGLQRRKLRNILLEAKEAMECIKEGREPNLEMARRRLQDIVAIATRTIG